MLRWIGCSDDNNKAMQCFGVALTLPAFISRLGSVLVLAEFDRQVVYNLCLNLMKQTLSKW